MPFIAQALFSKGELSPRLHARSDLEQWKAGLELCSNWLILRQGGLRKRAGTRFIAEVKTSAVGARIVPFVFSSAQTYVLELGNTYGRVFSQQARVENAGAPVEFATPFTLQQVKEIDYTHSGDVLYALHKAVRPQKIVRTSDVSWSCANETFINQPADWTASPANWPSKGCYYNERLTLAATATKPQTVWNSKSTNILDFGVSTPLVDTDAIATTMTTGETEPIQWIVEGGEILMATTAAARSLGPAGTGAFSNNNRRQRKHDSNGAEAVRPIQIGPVTLFVGRFGISIQEMIYKLETGGYVAPDITTLSEHLFRSGIVDWAYSQKPDSIVWMALGDGSLVGMTYERDQNTIALHKHTIGGNGFVESLCVIPGETRFELWLLVRRTIGGVTKRYIEVLEKPFEAQPIADGFFVDSGLTYDGAPTNVITGAVHLAGETVDIVADGAVMPRQVMPGNGVITLPNGLTASKVHIGLPYSAVGRTLPFAEQVQDGAGFMRKCRAGKVHVDLMETNGLRIGPSLDKLDDVILRGGATAMNSPVPLYSGAKPVHPESRWSGRGQVFFVSDRPQPATVRALNVEYIMEP